MSTCEKNSAVLESVWEAVVHGYGPVVRRQVRRSLRLAGVQRPQREQIDEREQEVYYRLLAGGSRRMRLFQRWSEGQRVNYLSRISQGVVADEMRARAAVTRGHGSRFTLVGRLCEIDDPGGDPRAPELEVLPRAVPLAVLSACGPLLAPTVRPDV